MVLTLVMPKSVKLEIETHELLLRVKTNARKNQKQYKSLFTNNFVIYKALQWLELKQKEYEKKQKKKAKK